MKSIKESIMQALNEEAAPSNSKIPADILIKAVATEDEYYIEEYLEDNDVENYKDYAKQIWNTVKGWEARYAYSSDTTTWEHELAYNNVSEIGVPSKELNRIVKKCEKIMMQEHGQIELECFPETSSDIYNKTNRFVICCGEETFGWMAIPKSASRKDVNFIQSILWYVL